MPRLFRRVVEVSVGGVEISLLRIDFDIRRRTSGEQPGGEIVIHNLSDEYLYELSQTGLAVVLTAGYDESAGEIFRGLTAKAEHCRSAEGSNARSLKLYVGGMTGATKQVTLTAVNMTSREYARRICSQVGLKVDVGGLPNVDLRSPTHAGVPARRALNDICEKVSVKVGRRISWHDDDGVVRFSSRGAAAPAASRLTISPTTGLVGSPEQTDDDGLRVHTLLNHEVQIGSTITLTGLGRTPAERQERQMLRVMELRHHGTNWSGQFRTTLELRQITAAGQ